MYTDLTTFCIAQGRTIREAMALMDTNRYGIVLVVDGERRLVATVTDGDIR
ncbi:MAG: CBS domain-containing protein, partial [Armatimonadetes bacterium]|nr:CBS domain-containing protein [Armatimonadota bacterium]